MTDRLSDLLWTDVSPNKKKSDDPEERVIEALRKALAATTPERPGKPWDSEEEDKDGRPGIRIPESNGA